MYVQVSQTYLIQIVEAILAAVSMEQVPSPCFRVHHSELKPIKKVLLWNIQDFALYYPEHLIKMHGGSHRG